MEIPIPPHHIAYAGLRALYTVATIKNPLQEVQRNFMLALQTHVFKNTWDLDAIQPITPQELASEVKGTEFAERMMGGCVIMSLLGNENIVEKKEKVVQFSEALGIHHHALNTLQRYCNENMMHVRWDIARRFTPWLLIQDHYKTHGFVKTMIWVVRMIRDMRGNARLAQEYKAWRDLPSGTLGREYYDFIMRNKFPFPGERGSAPEFVVNHDCMHVLTGYSTEPSGEVQIAAFQGGMHKQDPFGMLLFLLMQFHVGLVITPIAPAYHEPIDMRKIMAAYMRGRQTNRDLMLHWQPREHAHETLETIRQRYNVVSQGSV